MIYLATDTGQVEIDASELNLPGAKVVLLKNGKMYAAFDLKLDKQPQTIRAGQYAVQLRNAPGAKLEIWSKSRDANIWGEPVDHENDPIVLYRGGGMLVRVSRQKAEQINRLTLRDRLQGKWVPVSGHMRTEAMTAEQLSNMSVTFDGNRVTLTDPDSGQPLPSATFTIDRDRDPQHITMTAPDGSETLPGIVRFDGEQLRLAWVDEDYARPTDFSPSDTADHMTLLLEQAPLAGPAPGETERDVLKAASEFLAVMDAGTFGQLHDMSASWAKQMTTRGETSRTHQKIRDSFGKAVQRTLYRAHQIDQDPNLPEGRYAVVLYKSRFERQSALWETLALTADTDGQWRVITYAWTLEPPKLPAPKTDDAPTTTQKKQAALTAAQQWLKLVDAGKYGDAWEACAEQTRKADDKQTLVTAYTRLFQSTGKLKSRALLTNKYATGASGEFVNIQYDTTFARTRVIETVALIREKDGKWRVSGYFHQPRPIVPTPPPAVPVGENLIIDPSLENTMVGERYPQGWGKGNIIPKDAYRHQVVEGGRTGKHAWMIEGDGEYQTLSQFRYNRLRREWSRNSLALVSH